MPNPMANQSRRNATARMRQAKRRGVALLMVLGLLAIAMAVAYTMMRGQTTITKIQVNSGRRIDARHAAVAGINSALQKIHAASWSGVDVPNSGSLNSYEGFNVSVTTGDAALQVGDSNYGEFPYRLTISSTGYAADPSNANIRTEHKITVVAQLLRRALPSAPANWQTLQNYTVYQWSSDAANISHPTQIKKAALLNGELRLGSDYSWTTSVRGVYFTDLEELRQDGWYDYRPFTGGTLYLGKNRTPSTMLNLVRNSLSTTVQEVEVSTTSPLTLPGTIQTYQLYPGGKAYTIPNLRTTYGSTLTNLTLGPDPLENPLGIFRSDSDLYLGNNVTIEGTLLIQQEKDLRIQGNNVELRPATLPALMSSSQTFQLPTVIVADDLLVESTSLSSKLKGFVIAADEFTINSGPDSNKFDLTGRLMSKKFLVSGRNGLKAMDWASTYTTYVWVQMFLDPEDRIEFFPLWVQYWKGYSPEPTLTFNPPSPDVTYHWQDWTKPVFSAHSNDSGLLWEIVSWKEG